MSITTSIKVCILLLAALMGSCYPKNTQGMQGKCNVSSKKKPVKYHHVIPSCAVLSEELYRKVKNKEVIDEKFVLQYLESISKDLSVKRMQEIIKLEKTDDIVSHYSKKKAELVSYLNKDETIVFDKFVEKLESLSPLKEEKYFCMRYALYRFEKGDDYWPWD